MSRVTAVEIGFAVLIVGVGVYVVTLPGQARSKVVVEIPWASELYGMAWHPHSSTLAVGATLKSMQDDHEVIRLVTVDLSGKVTLVTDNHIDGGPVWSPQGDAILFLREPVDWAGLVREVDEAGKTYPEVPLANNIYVVSPDGARVEALTELDAGRAYIRPTWSSDGKYVAAIAYPHEIWVAAAPTRAKGKLSTGVIYQLPATVALIALTWSPNADSLAALAIETAPGTWALMQTLYRVEVPSGEWSKLASFGHTRMSAESMRWSLDGQSIIIGEVRATENGGLRFWKVPYREGDVKPLFTLETPSGYDWLGQFSWQPNMNAIAVIAERFEPLHLMLCLFSTDDGSCMANLLSAASLRDPRWSPGGQWIACVRNHNEIVILDASGY